MNIRPSAAIRQNYNEIAEKIITGWFIKNKIKVSGIGESKTSQMPDFFLHFLIIYISDRYCIIKNEEKYKNIVDRWVL